MVTTAMAFEPLVKSDRYTHRHIDSETNRTAEPDLRERALEVVAGERVASCPDARCASPLPGLFGPGDRGDVARGDPSSIEDDSLRSASVRSQLECTSCLGDSRRRP